MRMSDTRHDDEEKGVPANKKLVEALRVLQEEQFHEMDDGFDESEPHEFSDEFEDKMDLLISSHKEAEKKREKAAARKRKPYGFLFDHMWKRASVIALVVIAASIVVGTQVDAIRLPMVNIITEMYDDYIGVRIDPKDGPGIDMNQTLETLYEPVWMPKGYKVSERELGLTYYNVVYERKNGRALYFYQYFDNSLGAVNNEGTDYKKMVVKGNTYYYAENESETLLIWYDGKYRFRLDGEEDINGLIKISKKMTSIN